MCSLKPEQNNKYVLLVHVFVPFDSLDIRTEKFHSHIENRDLYVTGDNVETENKSKEVHNLPADKNFNYMLHWILS